MMGSPTTAGVHRRLVSAALAVALALTAVVVVAPASLAATNAPVRIGADEDLVAASIAISEETFDTGTAAHVVVGRHDVFADSLAGTALAGTAGPLLFAPGGAGGGLPNDLRAEIQRVLPSPGSCQEGTQVFILGGTNAVSSSIEDAIEGDGYCVKRLSGTGRVETGVAVAKEVATRGGVDTVLLATAGNWPDAATGGAFAAAAGAPVLLTDANALSSAVRDFLNREMPDNVYALGGRSALSDSVVSAAKAQRVSGTSRAGTAAAIASDLWVDSLGAPTGITLVNGYVDSGWGYALAGGVAAARDDAPMLYADRNELPPETTSFLDATDFYLVTAVGPTSLLDRSVTTASGYQTPGMVLLTSTNPVSNSHDSYGAARNINGEVYLHSLVENFDRYRRVGDAGRTSFDLGRDYDTFRATVGVTDYSQDIGGRVQFDVYLDGSLAETRQLAFGVTEDLEVPVTGALRLELVTTALHDTDSTYGGGWGNPRVLATGAPDTAYAYVNDGRGPAEADLVSYDQALVSGSHDGYEVAVNIDGATYLKSMYERFDRYRSVGDRGLTRYNLGRDYDVFTAVVGIVDGSQDAAARVQFDVVLDGVVVESKQAAFGETIPVTVNVSGGLRLVLMTTALTETTSSYSGAWGNPKIARTS